jgi:two-component sensor histidine kinase
MNTRPKPPKPRPAYWWCQVGGWGAYLLVNLVASQGFYVLNARVVGGFVFLSATGIVLTHAFRDFLFRRGWMDLRAAQLVPRVVAVNFVLALAIVALVYVYFSILPPASKAPWSSRPAPTGYFSILVVYTFNDFIILTLWSGIYFGVAYFERQRRLEIERYQARTALAEAELRGLKTQLNPHFLFNSLNSLRALVVEDPGRAQTAITQMAGILRYHLQSGERSLVPLAEEIETAEQYLALELIRFEDRLSVTRQFQPEALASLVPPLALQTLVENAIKYGISRHSGPGRIELSAETRDGVLDISVRNSGELQSTSSDGSTGVGLANLRTRLRLLFGDKAGVELRESTPGWVETRLTLPAADSLDRQSA